jgi:hypothetical protein
VRDAVLKTERKRPNKIGKAGAWASGRRFERGAFSSGWVLGFLRLDGRWRGDAYGLWRRIPAGIWG